MCDAVINFSSIQLPFKQRYFHPPIQLPVNKEFCLQ